MTKRQYLKKLENCIQALPIEERTEALEYYSNYFDDADDDDKVMQELGSPEELAKTIIEKFTCVPAKTKSKKQNSKSDIEEEILEDEDFYQERLCYEFDKKKILNLGIAVGAGDIFIKSGTLFKVETKGISQKDFHCEINQAGTLIIENNKFPSSKKKYGHAIKNRWCPRILITVPKCDLENFKITLTAGQIKSKGLSIFSKKFMADVAAGNMILDGINSESANVHCAMGNVSLNGNLLGLSKIDVAMGSVKINMNQNQEDFSCDSKVGLGSIKFGNQKYNGFNQIFNTDKKKNHFFLSVGLGDIKIKFDD